MKQTISAIRVVLVVLKYQYIDEVKTFSIAEWRQEILNYVRSLTQLSQLLRGDKDFKI